MKKSSSLHPDAIRLLLAANERAQDELRTILARVLPDMDKRPKEQPTYEN